MERIHLKFCKLLLKLNNGISSYMIYGELDRYPLDIDIKLRKIAYWTKLIISKEIWLSSIAYKLYIVNKTVLPFIRNVNKMSDECGYSNVWDKQSSV